MGLASLTELVCPVVLRDIYSTECLAHGSMCPCVVMHVHLLRPQQGAEMYHIFCIHYFFCARDGGRGPGMYLRA